MRSLLALLLLAGPAQAEEAWTGFYTCAQGQTGLTLTVEVGAGGAASALFHFYGNGFTTSKALEGCFSMTGRVDRATGHVDLQGEHWLLHPDGYVTVDLHGNIQSLDVTGRSDKLNVMTGTVAGPGCSEFFLTRSQTLSSDLRHPPSACYGASLS